MDFVQDFLAELRLDNKDLHELVTSFAQNFIRINLESATDENERIELDIENESFFKKMVENPERMKELAETIGNAFALGQCMSNMAVFLVAVVYKSIKATTEAEELEQSS